MTGKILYIIIQLSAERSLTMETPLVSVIMSVYNGEAYLKAAVLSILNQTYQNFEFIIIDDCSTDNSFSILKNFNDKRIHLIRNEKNLKLPSSLNIGLKASKGKYIIRMDADDISLPRRIEKQVKFMEAHSDIAIAFSDVLRFSGKKIQIDFNTNDLSFKGIQSILLFYNVINHTAVIINKNLIPDLTYPTKYSIAEDMALWILLLKNHKVSYMRENLVLYRIHEKQVSSAMTDLQRQQVVDIKTPILNELTGGNENTNYELHTLISLKTEKLSVQELMSWMYFLEKSNSKNKVYPPGIFRENLVRMIFIVGMNNKYPKKILIKALFRFGSLPLTFFIIKAFYNGLLDIFYLIPGIIKGRKLL